MTGYVLDNHLAVFSLVRFPDAFLVTDADVRRAMDEENLRPVSREEFQDYVDRFLEGRAPERKLIAFGNSSSGPSDQGSFRGTPCLDIDGELKVVEDWTRGPTGDQWEGDLTFLFWQNR